VDLRKTVLFYGRASYSDTGVTLGDVWDYDMSVEELARKYMEDLVGGKGVRVFSFSKAHPNVGRNGWLCHGTLGRPSASWSDERKIRHLIGLLGMFSVPNFDNRLGDMGLKAARALKDALPKGIYNCLVKRG
jgi:hypothetical protein